MFILCLCLGWWTDWLTRAKCAFVIMKNQHLAFAVTLSTSQPVHEYNNVFIPKNLCFRFTFNYIHRDYFLKKITPSLKHFLWPCLPFPLCFSCNLQIPLCPLWEFSNMTWQFSPKTWKATQFSLRVLFPIKDVQFQGESRRLLHSSSSPCSKMVMFLWVWWIF